MLHLLAYTKEMRDELEQAKSYHDIFQLVQAAVRHVLRESRAGLNLGIMELGNGRGQFLGAFYPAESNIIVLNSTPLRRIAETDQRLFKPYLFHVLLHEYLHSLGYLDEPTVRRLAYSICVQALGEAHPATAMTTNIEKFFPNLVYPGGAPADRNRMLLIEDLDRGMDYID